MRLEQQEDLLGGKWVHRRQLELESPVFLFRASGWAKHEAAKRSAQTSVNRKCAAP
jgi:hypothetical protein